MILFVLFLLLWFGLVWFVCLFRCCRHCHYFCFVRSEFFGTLNTHTQNVLSYSLFCFLSLSLFLVCFYESMHICFGNGVFSFYFFRNRLWLVHHHTYIHTTMLLVFLVFWVFSQSVVVLVGGPYTYTHTTMLLVFSQQVPNPEAFVLLGEIGYVFHFDNIIFFLKRESLFFCFWRHCGGMVDWFVCCCCFCLYHLGG